MAKRTAQKIQERCLDCRACEEIVACPGEEECIGCEACALACPNSAIEMVEVEAARRVTIEIDGISFEVPEGITVRQALEGLGFHVARFPGEGLFMPCQTGGCWACMLEINGELKRACLSQVEEGMEIRKDPKDSIPQRLIGGFMGHSVGGVGTPWWLKGRAYIEVACFASGCNLRCPQCQNWGTTYLSRGTPLRPGEAARIMTAVRGRHRVNRMAISGGECTLNRRWLVQYLRELKRLNPDHRARLHIDTNGSILTGDYIDELVDAGMTDIGIDLKALYTKTFMHITGVENEALGTRYKETAWKAVGYILENYPQVFLGVGIPYNRKLISFTEIEEMGQRIFRLDPGVQVCVLDYRPAFRRTWLSHPTYKEMSQVHKILRSVGLKNVICQTPLGHIGPHGQLLS